MDWLKFARWIDNNYKELIKEPKNFSTREATFTLTYFNHITPKLIELMNERAVKEIKAEDFIDRWVIVRMRGLF